MKLILTTLWVFCLVPLHAATTLPVVEKYDWSFSLARTASITSNYGSVAIQFLVSNKLQASEYIKIRLFAADTTTPFYSVNMTGNATGLDGVAALIQNLDDSLPGLQGRVELSMFINGTVDVGSITVYARDGASEYYANVKPNVRLVPEPGVAFLVTLAGGLLFQRRRAAGNQDSPPGLSQ